MMQGMEIPRPTGEGWSEGATFAQQTETNLPSYRPNVLTTSNKLDCFARSADSGNGARNDVTILVPQYLSALVPSKNAAFTLAEGATHVAQPKNVGKAAFTLAEVLITLSIIGVVAAMTMPVLINKHREQVTVSKVKKFYSTMGQALNLAINENGTVDGWYPSVIKTTSWGKTIMADGTTLASPLKPHLKILKDCGVNSNCVYGSLFKYLRGDFRYDGYRNEKVYTLILADGTTMWITANGNGWPEYRYSTCETGACGSITLDINGKNPPNTYGRDVFLFVILRDRIKPHDGNCSLKGDGLGCSAYILKNGNMNYLHE